MKIPVWKTLTIGNRDSEYYRKSFREGGFKISDWANSILARATLLNLEEKTIDLSVVTVGELGFGDGGYLGPIVDRARQFGLDLCPAEAGPASRLAYIEQPQGEDMHIIMEPIPTYFGYYNLLSLAHNDKGLWLLAWFHEGALDPEEKLAFLHPNI